MYNPAFEKQIKNRDSNSNCFSNGVIHFRQSQFLMCSVVVTAHDRWTILNIT